MMKYPLNANEFIFVLNGLVICYGKKKQNLLFKKLAEFGLCEQVYAGNIIDKVCKLFFQMQYLTSFCIYFMIKTLKQQMFLLNEMKRRNPIQLCILDVIIFPKFKNQYFGIKTGRHRTIFFIPIIDMLKQFFKN